MNKLKKLQNMIEQLQQDSQHFKQMHNKYSNLMHFPSIQNFVSELTAFENYKYLELINDRSFKGVYKKIKEINKIIGSMSLTLQVVNQQVNMVFQNQEKQSRRSSQFQVYDQKRYSTLNIYDLFLDRALRNNQEELYKQILQEQIKLQKLKNQNLTQEIKEQIDDKQMEQFIYFLKNYVSKYRRLKWDEYKSAIYGLHKIGVPQKLLKYTQQDLQKVDEEVERLRKHFDKINFVFKNKDDYIKFHNYLKAVLHSLIVKKHYEIQKQAIAQFFIARAYKFFSIMYEDNIKKFNIAQKQFDQAKEEQRFLQNSIKKFKAEILNNLDF